MFRTADRAGLLAAGLLAVVGHREVHSQRVGAV